jgi:hypothetical protein
MYERQARLTGCHRVLRFHDIRSVDAYRAASRELLSDPPSVPCADPPPRQRKPPRRYGRALAGGAVTWNVAGVTGTPTVRLLAAKRG